MDDTAEHPPFELSEEDRRLLSLGRWTGPTARRLVEAYESSGLSAEAFAELGGADRRRFVRLIERMRSTASDEHGFAAVDVQAGEEPIVVHAGGAAIAVRPGFDPALLRRVVSALAC